MGTLVTVPRSRTDHAPFCGTFRDDLHFKVFQVERASPTTTRAMKATRLREERSSQVSSSADLTASMPQLRGVPYVTYGLWISLRIDSSDYRCRGSMHKGTRHGFFKSDFKCRQECKNKASATAPLVRGLLRCIRISVIAYGTRVMAAPDLSPQSLSPPSVTEVAIAGTSRSSLDARHTGNHPLHPSHGQYDIV